MHAMIREDSPVPDLYLNGEQVLALAGMRLEMTGSDGTAHTYRHDGRGLQQDCGAVRSSFHCGGDFLDANGHVALVVSCRLDVHAGPSSASLIIGLHNPRAARHAGGYWDLGDEGSCLFGDVSLVVRRRAGDALDWRLSGEGGWNDSEGGSLVLSQTSSGGTLDDSPNHVGASGKVPALQHGFQVWIDGQKVSDGARCSPRFRLRDAEASCIVHVERFWENFPKRVEAKADCLRIGLFPGSGTETFELQGGEKKTHTLHFVLGGTDPGWLDGDIVCRADRDDWRSAEALPYLDADEPDRGMEALIAEGVDGADNFFVKRERIDEYGWRHFGDIHADHETWQLDSAEPLSSHYNNQYDVLYGFIRQSVYSERPEWNRLARDLACHVLDIDLYDTRADRPEYNGGLFWHTDHYRPALTSTHRTYSIGHARDDASATGGGPGGEHCYTRGLKLYHLTSGCQRARQAVLDLAEWVLAFYEGSGTVLEAIQDTVRSGSPTLLAVMRGKPISRHRYPVHRGIGNLVVAQLDAFELTGSRRFLERAERVVLGAIGPQDDLEARGLSDAEQSWFYTIFLQALIAYLDVKRGLGEFDAAFFYARDSLLHYSDWILAREKPYLDDPAALQYPNHTWAAQDIRRCAILLDAFRYAPVQRVDLLARSRFFAEYVVTTLRDEPTKSYTRILAILMQNHGASADTLTNPRRHDLPPAIPYAAELHRPHTIGSVLSRHAMGIHRALRQTSPRAELDWLRNRLRR